MFKVGDWVRTRRDFTARYSCGTPPPKDAVGWVIFVGEETLVQVKFLGGYNNGGKSESWWMHSKDLEKWEPEDAKT